MGIEERINKDGQKQIINNFDKIVKIDGRFLQVRLIETKLWRDRYLENGKYTAPMPRAKFINPLDYGNNDNFYYLVSKRDLVKMIAKKKK